MCAIGVSGPTARLQDRVDHIGRLLVEQSEALSDLLGRRPTRTTTPNDHQPETRAGSPTKEGAA